MGCGCIPEMAVGQVIFRERWPAMIQLQRSCGIMGWMKTTVWKFWRESYPWATRSRKSCPKRFRALEVRLEAELEQHPAERFRTPAVGGSVTLHEPGNAQTYQLTALDVRSETLELPDCDGWEWPNRFCMMTYRLTPAAENFFLSSCVGGPPAPPTPESAA